MYFNIFGDAGDRIEGYLIPDGFSTKPRVVVRHNDEIIGPIHCNVYLAGPHQHKHHETGIVGFVLTPDIIPALAAGSSLEISDADTGFVFYRRFNPAQHIEKRVFRLETQFAPHFELDRSLQPYFQFFGSSAERYGSETVRQMLEIANQTSTYVSGRVSFKAVQKYLSDDTILVTSMRDPFYELAIRIWVVGTHKRRATGFLSERDQVLFSPAISYFEQTDFTKLTEFRQKIIAAPKDVLSLFESPFTQQLVSPSPTDKVSREGISSALDALSQFTLFEPNEERGLFALDISEILGVRCEDVVFSSRHTQFSPITDILREIKTVEHILENDLILHHFIEKAHTRAVTPHKQ